MKPTNNIAEIALQALEIEIKSVEGLRHFINSDFNKGVELLNQCNGRVVFTGIGKSAIIAQKLVATFNSTGTPALFMHAADAIHGDLGMIQKDDCVVCISKSGTSPEIKVLLPLIKNRGNKIIAIGGNPEGFMAVESDVFVNSWVQEEACPNNLAPTTSAVTQMIMGDLMAVCLMRLKGFTDADFAMHHPGGALGKKLYTKVAELIENQDAPAVLPTSTLDDVIVEITTKRLGATAVVENGVVLGVITDGDLRRMLAKKPDLSVVTAKEIMTPNPMTIPSDTLAAKAFSIIESKKITQLVVVDNNIYKGLIHLHDILKEGIY